MAEVAVQCHAAIFDIPCEAAAELRMAMRCNVCGGKPSMFYVCSSCHKLVSDMSWRCTDCGNTEVVLSEPVRIN